MLAHLAEVRRQDECSDGARELTLVGAQHAPEEPPNVAARLGERRGRSSVREGRIPGAQLGEGSEPMLGERVARRSFVDQRAHLVDVEDEPELQDPAAARVFGAQRVEIAAYERRSERELRELRLLAFEVPRRRADAAFRSGDGRAPSVVFLGKRRPEPRESRGAFFGSAEQQFLVRRGEFRVEAGGRRDVGLDRVRALLGEPREQRRRVRVPPVAREQLADECDVLRVERRRERIRARRDPLDRARLAAARRHHVDDAGSTAEPPTVTTRVGLEPRRRRVFEAQLPAEHALDALDIGVAQAALELGPGAMRRAGSGRAATNRTPDDRDRRDRHHRGEHGEREAGVATPTRAGVIEPPVLDRSVRGHRAGQASGEVAAVTEGGGVLGGGGPTPTEPLSIPNPHPPGGNDAQPRVR